VRGERLDRFHDLGHLGAGQSLINDLGGHRNLGGFVFELAHLVGGPGGEGPLLYLILNRYGQFQQGQARVTVAGLTASSAASGELTSRSIRSGP